jgi:indolepyruvate ferredoxin oxidoreductase alpha subunit
VIDPVADVKKAIAAVLEALEEEGAKVIVFRRACPTFEKKRHQQEQLLSPSIDPEKCTGDACGCNRFCSRVLSCPAIEYDAEENRARIWEDICTGCGLCAQVCPRGAISFREVKEGMANESE